MVYMITYDLNKEGQKYKDVINAIKDASSGVWCSYWESSYIIKSNLTTADDVFKLIKPHLDSNDLLFIAEITNNYQGWLTEEQWNYINSSIFG